DLDQEETAKTEEEHYWEPYRPTSSRQNPRMQQRQTPFRKRAGMSSRKHTLHRKTKTNSRKPEQKQNSRMRTETQLLSFSTRYNYSIPPGSMEAAVVYNFCQREKAAFLHKCLPDFTALRA